ncbi:unnamed protein product, partial [Linum tenue]
NQAFPTRTARVHGRAHHHSGRALQNAAFHLVGLQPSCTARCTAVQIFRGARARPRHKAHGQLATVHGRAASLVCPCSSPKTSPF